jgi:hypothetical protein
MRYVGAFLISLLALFPSGQAQEQTKNTMQQQTKSIAQLVAELNTRVSSLEKSGPVATTTTSAPAAAAPGQFALQNIELQNGRALFKATNGSGEAQFGVGDLGWGGAWLYGKQGKMVAYLGASTTGLGRLDLMNPDGKSFVVIENQSNSEGGVVNFFNSSGTRVATTGSAIQEGGAAWYYSKDGKLVANMGASTSGEGRLALTYPNGNSLATLYAPQTGGVLDLYSASKNVVVAEIGASADGTGAAWFYDQAGTLVAQIGALQGGGNGWLFIKGRDSKDFAEYFEIADPTHLAPGSVVSASDSGAGLEPSKGAYDPTVVGVLAGAGGLHSAVAVGGSESAREMPVALAGQVYVRVCAENGAIHTGDLLVASSHRGVAMRATDRSKIIGATLGKALQPFDGANEGQIRMLVMLH